MIKLYIFETVKEAIDFNANKEVINVEIPKKAKPEVKEEYEEDESPTRKYKKHPCKNCGKNGHTARKCPKVESPDFSEGKPEDKKSIKPFCAACNENGHIARDCSRLNEAIQRLKKNGKDSLRIAALLGISLKTINEFWNKEIDPLPLDDEEMTEDDE